MRSDKIALITGASRGIGLEVAKQLAERNFHVFLTARQVDAAMKAATMLRQNGLEVDFTELDVANQESIKRATVEIAARVDHLDVLVNNAAIYPDEGTSSLAVDPSLVNEASRPKTIAKLKRD